MFQSYRHAYSTGWRAGRSPPRFEESFIILEGEIEATFRGVKSIARAGGVPVATRTTAPPNPGAKAQAEFTARAAALAPKYRTELLQHAEGNT